MMSETTEFRVEIMPKDSGPHRTLYTRVEAAIVMQPGQSFGLWDGMTIEVLDCSVYPTMDPMVYIRGRSLFPETTKEANEIIETAMREEGWKVLG